jgi:hypothetical protein
MNGEKSVLRVIAQALPLRTLRNTENSASGAETTGQRGKVSQEASQERKPAGRQEEERQHMGGW